MRGNCRKGWKKTPSPFMGEGWGEGNPPPLIPLPQGAGIKKGRSFCSALFLFPFYFFLTPPLPREIPIYRDYFTGVTSSSSVISPSMDIPASGSSNSSSSTVSSTPSASSIMSCSRLTTISSSSLFKISSVATRPS